MDKDEWGKDGADSGCESQNGSDFWAYPRELNLGAHVLVSFGACSASRFECMCKSDRTTP